jgi:superfamily II DNA or RNA helicase
MIKKILKNNVKSWSCFYKELVKLPDDPNLSKAGFLFEDFAKLYFLNTRDFKHVYKYNEIPQKLKKKLELPDTDHGIDLLLVTDKSKYVGVQVKFRKNQRHGISWSKDKLANLLAHHQVDQHIIFSNASSVDKTTSKQGKLFQKYLINNLLDLTEEDFKQFRAFSKGKVLKRKKIIPRSHQKKAIDSVLKGYKTENRGQLILPCGAGKTLTSLWIMEKLSPGLTLVLVPSLALLRQIKNEWIKYRKDSFDYICVCSERDIDKYSEDSSVGSVDELGATGAGVTTDSKEIKSFMKSKGNKVVFSTYQSSPMIEKALTNTKLTFDFSICDEAHKTASHKSSIFSTIHDDKKIKVKKRLYMTATPRIIANKVKSKFGKDVYNYIADMNDIQTFGKVFYRMSFKEAIDAKILVDYTILAVGVSDNELRNYIVDQSNVDDKNLQDTANNYALHKVMNKHGATHAITFHSRVKAAKSFSENHKLLDKKCATFHVSGKQSTAERQVVLDEFKNSKKALISNARCLTEGVDVPAIDLVYFCDPKNSKVDIIQASGRALRLNKEKGKTRGYIVVPIYHAEKDLLEDSIQNGAYKNLIQVIRAMSDQDDRLEDEITKILWGKGQKIGNGRSINIDLGLIENGMIQLENLDKKMKESIFSQVIRKNIGSQWRPFEQAREYIQSLGLESQKEWWKYIANEGDIERAIDIPSRPHTIYKDSGWCGYGDFLGSGRIASQDIKYMEFKDARKYARTFGFVKRSQWLEHLRLNNIPGMPKNPANTYKGKGWKDYSDFLGSDIVTNFNVKYISFIKARKYARSLKLQSRKQWFEHWAEKKPKGIPRSASGIYKLDGWINWADWLGKEQIVPSATDANKTFDSSKYMEYGAARKFVRSLKLKSSKEWDIYINGNMPGKDNLPGNIPRYPRKIYRDFGWINLADWLGTKSIRKGDTKYLSYSVAKKIVNQLELKSAKEWREYCKSGKKSENIPSAPNYKYEAKGWKNWSDWLGTKTESNNNREYLNYEKAKEFVSGLKLKTREEWTNYCRGKTKHKSKPGNISGTPQRTYKGEGWINWADWLGK